MKKIKYIIVLLISFSTLGINAQDNLNEYLVLAAKNNPELKSKFNQYLASLERVPQVKALPDPQLAFGYFIQPVETRVGPQQIKFSASQMFPWFGLLKAKENEFIQLAKANFEAFEESKSKLFSDIKNNYFDLYFNQKAIEITTENLRILETFHAIVLIKVEAGLVSAVDEYRIEMEIKDLENRLFLLKDQQYSLEIRFLNLLNIQTYEPVQLPLTLWESNLAYSKEEVMDSIESQNHKLLMLELQRESLLFRKTVAEKSGNPSFNIGLDYTIIGKGSNNLAGKDAFIFPKIGLTIPLWREKYKAKVKEVVYLETAKANEKLNTRNLLNTLLESTWKDLNDADRRIPLYKSQLDLAEKSLHLLETEYTTANSNFEEILRMERKLLKYGLELEKARADKQASIAFINYLMGK